jgi:Na+-transporting NADH:ubiquinone oxidoreductase subunit NqrF
MQSLRVRGQASGKILLHIDIQESQLDLTMLNFLSSKGITIASSCQGEGVCRKCVINAQLLTCQITLRKYLTDYPNQDVCVAYL